VKRKQKVGHLSEPYPYDVAPVIDELTCLQIFNLSIDKVKKSLRKKGVMGKRGWETIAHQRSARSTTTPTLTAQQQCSTAAVQYSVVTQW
jgi:hypothetical protein